MGRPILRAIAVALPMTASAQQEPPEGCFCLAEAAEILPQVQRGCTREKFPNQFYWRAICRYIEASNDKIVVAPAITITEAWTILPADHPDCAVCKPAARDIENLPRGDDGQEAEVTE